MPCYVDLDASKKTTAICVLDAGGAILREAVVPTTVADIVGALRGDGARAHPSPSPPRAHHGRG